MKLLAKIFSVVSILTLILAIGLSANTANTTYPTPIGFFLVILFLFLFNLVFMLKGKSNASRIILIILNVVIGILAYLPFLMYLLQPRTSTSILLPAIAVLVSLPFAINIIALVKEKPTSKVNG